MDHTSHDDPIVFPGIPAATHLHEFFGAKGINYNSTAKSELASPTTCNNPQDTGGYWTPTAEMNGQVITPQGQNEYWFDGGFKKTSLMPFGLEMTGGNARATAPEPTNQVYYFCGIGSPHENKPYACKGAGTGSGSIIMVVEFPNCWNGYLNTYNNDNNVAYQSGFGQCPAGFPIALPRLEEHVHIGITTPYDSHGNFVFSLSSGPYYTLHGDFIQSWHESELNAFTTTCINAHKVCGNSPLGPGTLPSPTPLVSPSPSATPSPTPTPTPTPTPYPTPTPTPTNTGGGGDGGSGGSTGGSGVGSQWGSTGTGGTLDVNSDTNTSVDGTNVPTPDGTLDTTYLNNGTHTVTTPNGSTSKVSVNNKLNPFEAVRNFLFAAFIAHPSVMNVMTVLLILLIIGGGFYALFFWKVFPITKH